MNHRLPPAARGERQSTRISAVAGEAGGRAEQPASIGASPGAACELAHSDYTNPFPSLMLPHTKAIDTEGMESAGRRRRTRQEGQKGLPSVATRWRCTWQKARECRATHRQNVPSRARPRDRPRGRVHAWPPHLNGRQEAYSERAQSEATSPSRGPRTVTEAIGANASSLIRPSRLCGHWTGANRAAGRDCGYDRARLRAPGSARRSKSGAVPVSSPFRNGTQSSTTLITT